MQGNANEWVKTHQRQIQCKDKATQVEIPVRGKSFIGNRLGKLQPLTILREKTKQRQPYHQNAPHLKSIDGVFFVENVGEPNSDYSAIPNLQETLGENKTRSTFDCSLSDLVLLVSGLCLYSFLQSNQGEAFLRCLSTQFVMPFLGIKTHR